MIRRQNRRMVWLGIAILGGIILTGIVVAFIVKGSGWQPESAELRDYKRQILERLRGEELALGSKLRVEWKSGVFDDGVQPGTGERRRAVRADVHYPDGFVWGATFVFINGKHLGSH